jgi:hypothetical protein
MGIYILLVWQKDLDSSILWSVNSSDINSIIVRSDYSKWTMKRSTQLEGLTRSGSRHIDESLSLTENVGILVFLSCCFFGCFWAFWTFYRALAQASLTL